MEQAPVGLDLGEVARLRPEGGVPPVPGDPVDGSFRVVQVPPGQRLRQGAVNLAAGDEPEPVRVGTGWAAEGDEGEGEPFDLLGVGPAAVPSGKGASGRGEEMVSAGSAPGR